MGYVFFWSLKNDNFPRRLFLLLYDLGRSQSLEIKPTNCNGLQKRRFHLFIKNKTYGISKNEANITPRWLPRTDKTQQQKKTKQNCRKQNSKNTEKIWKRNPHPSDQGAPRGPPSSRPAPFSTKKHMVQHCPSLYKRFPASPRLRSGATWHHPWLSSCWLAGQ